MRVRTHGEAPGLVKTQRERRARAFIVVSKEGTGKTE